MGEKMVLMIFLIGSAVFTLWRTAVLIDCLKAFYKEEEEHE